MTLAIIGFWNATITIENGYTGVVLRGENTIRHLPPGNHYHVPGIERVITLNTEIGIGREVKHQAQLSNARSCEYRVLYSFTVEDMARAVRALDYGNIKTLEPRLLEATIRDRLDAMAKETEIKDLEENSVSLFLKHMRDLRSITHADGTRGEGFYLASTECTDPAAVKALEIAHRPKFKPGPASPFSALSECGEPNDQTRELKVPSITIGHENNLPVDILDMVVYYHPISDAMPEPDEYLVSGQEAVIRNFVWQSLNRELRTYDLADLGQVNFCPLLLNSSIPETAFARAGLKLVALDPDTPQYAIYEPIEYQDEPAD